MGDGREGAEEAMADVAELRREQVETYLGYLRQCHLSDREDRLNEDLRKWAGIAPEEESREDPGLARFGRRYARQRSGLPPLNSIIWPNAVAMSISAPHSSPLSSL